MLRRSRLIERLAADAARMERMFPLPEISPATLEMIRNAQAWAERLPAVNPELFEIAAGLAAQLQSSPLLDLATVLSQQRSPIFDLAAGLSQQLAWLYPDDDLIEPDEDEAPQHRSIEEIHAKPSRRGRPRKVLSDAEIRDTKRWLEESLLSNKVSAAQRLGRKVRTLERWAALLEEQQQ